MPPSALRALRTARSMFGTGLVAALLLPAVAFATERQHRIFDHRHGLPTDTVTDVSQDTSGFIWIATPGGLVRFDGDEMRHWADGERGIDLVTTGPAGAIAAVDGTGHLLLVNPGGGADVLAGPDGRVMEDVRDARYDRAGSLWIVRSGEVLRRTSPDRWLRLSSSRFDNEAPRGVRPDGQQNVFVLTDRAVWSVDAAGEARRMFGIRYPIDVLRHRDGSLLVFADGTVFRTVGGKLEPVLQLPARAVELVSRLDYVWASFDSHIARIAPGEPAIVIGADEGLPAGGRMLVDREGSLWVCTFRGLMQFPEPDTIIWSERDGLPSSHARYLGRNKEGLWVSTWRGLARFRSIVEGPVRHAGGDAHVWQICLDGEDGLWYSGARVHERRNGRTLAHDGAGSLVWACAPSAGTGIWLGLGDALVRAEPGRMQRVPLPGASLEFGRPPTPLLEDDGRLWAGLPGRICHTTTRLPRRPEDWHCDALPAEAEPVAMLPVGETVWVATNGHGVYRRGADGWSQIPASTSVGGGRMFKLRPGAGGSVWVLSLGMPTRVVDRPDLADGWEVVEVISEWHGHPSGGASDLIEEPDGTIWTATAAGLVRVPGPARRIPMLPPIVALAGVFVDGREVASGIVPVLRHRESLIELRFAALTYRERTRVRYQVRLGSGGSWRDLTAGTPVFRFPNLPAGEYVAEVRATLDGRIWSTRSERLIFHVSGPWYLRPWVLALAMTTAAVVLLAIHRARLRLALRLERQRTQIAMDLHDEIGSGLGSIGILAGIADTRIDDTPTRALVKDIAVTSGELSTTLGDIVWSLRTRSRTLQELVERLAERGHRLFPEESSTTFVVQMAETREPVALSLAVQRDVLLIVVEALHNAARHARARRVELGLVRAGARWRICVIDDGIGFEAGPAPESRGGLGLRGMRRRAAEIGAELDVRSAPGRGTIISLSFDPLGEVAGARLA